MQKETLERLKEKYPDIIKDLGFLKLEKFVVEVLETEKAIAEAPVVETPEVEVPEIDMPQVGSFIMQIAHDVEEGAENAMKGYIKLKKIESGLKNALKLIGDLAYDDFENWDKNDLPFGYVGNITNRLYAKYEQDEEYADLKTKLKDREELLKEAINQNVKGNTMNDSDGCVVDVPEYSYKASLVVKKGVKKK